MFNYRRWLPETFMAQPIISEGVLHEWEYRTENVNSGVWMRGWFKAPRSGTYNFWVNGDESVRIYASEYNSGGVYDRIDP